MNSFQIIVLSIFVILAILVLTGFAIMLNSKKDADSEYPSSYNTCPDYWDVSGNVCVYNTIIQNGNETAISLNVNTPSSLYTAPHATTSHKVIFDEKHGDWVSKSSSLGVPYRCALKKWAKDTEVTWDGITNYNSAYC
jgi:hypothetical protein